jgi:hypothetical protein
MKPGSWSATMNVSECNHVDPDGRVHCPSGSWMLVFALRRIGMRKIRERTPADGDEVVGDNYSQADEGGQALSPIESRKFLYAELSRVGSARLRRERPNDRANLLLRHVERTPRHLGSVISAPWAAMMSKRVKGAGLVTTDRLFGLSWSGAMTEIGSPVSSKASRRAEPKSIPIRQPPQAMKERPMAIDIPRSWRRSYPNVAGKLLRNLKQFSAVMET